MLSHLLSLTNLPTTISKHISHLSSLCPSGFFDLEVEFWQRTGRAPLELVWRDCARKGDRRDLTEQASGRTGLWIGVRSEMEDHEQDC